MKLLLIGAKGTIGQAVAAALSQRHEVEAASSNNEMERVDIKRWPAWLRCSSQIWPGRLRPQARVSDGKGGSISCVPSA